VGGQLYQAISYIDITEKSGDIGYDVQVAPVVD
jgi:hypothetical protein